MRARGQRCGGQVREDARDKREKVRVRSSGRREEELSCTKTGGKKEEEDGPSHPAVISPLGSASKQDVHR